MTWRPTEQQGDALFQHATIKIIVEDEFPIPARQLWDVLAADDAVVGWSALATASTWVDGRRGVGSIREVVVLGFLGVRDHFYRWDIDRRMTFAAEATTAPGVKAFGEDYVLDATATGTRLRWTVAIDAGRAGRLLAPLARPALRIVFRAFMGGIHQVIHQRT
ncbi:SRPBCC family protein [Mycolicibacterium cosmeticum]|uniref:Polyketide cyclase/dehydrase and lipid transport n=1 Tax=Mycolicibacterium cosmeticum TaxID=258533 RepID=W9BMA8_MYCCO|nr:SRPBCC family protein [Mycolicibacterium cosmeticum]TLH74126.1 SRPBCC family protein [Mycolicibacterium cosmeticum]CDO11075.1 polyketide cyclase/dehydrase and lipid transport [Mycolicibacterium cosmeticum]